MLDTMDRTSKKESKGTEYSAGLVVANVLEGAMV